MSSFIKRGESEFRTSRRGIYWAFDKKRIEAMIAKKELVAPVKKKSTKLKAKN